MLRVARFAARYRHLGFAVAPETMALMGEIVLADELAYLSTERIWVEQDPHLENWCRGALAHRTG